MIERDKIVVVATHKEYRMPSDGMYLPVFVGSAAHGDRVTDGTGDNISAKNYCYCELTALYWAWKNTKSEVLGLAHYRRHFAGGGKGDKFDRILTADRLDGYLRECEVLLPKKRHYFIESNESQYLHAHHEEGLRAAESVIREYYPDHAAAWTDVMKKRSGHRFNMFIMTRRYADAYCEWLFDVLAKTEEKLDIGDWQPSEQRVFGYLGERLLDVWLAANDIRYKDIPYMFMEKQHWPTKIKNFLKRKFAGKGGGK